MYIYLPLSRFICPSQKNFIITLSGTIIGSSPGIICKIINHVHQHVCGHAKYSDMKTPLQRNNILAEAVQNQLQKTVSVFLNSRATAKPQPSHKMSLSSLKRIFNGVVCVDHFFLDGKPLLHLMDATPIFSTALIVPNASLVYAALAMETVWLGKFWPPNTILGDGAFNHTEIKMF